MRLDIMRKNILGRASKREFDTIGPPLNHFKPIVARIYQFAVLLAGLLSHLKYNVNFIRSSRWPPTRPSASPRRRPRFLPYLPYVLIVPLSLSLSLSLLVRRYVRLARSSGSLSRPSGTILTPSPLDTVRPLRIGERAVGSFRTIRNNRLEITQDGRLAVESRQGVRTMRVRLGTGCTCWGAPRRSRDHPRARPP